MNKSTLRASVGLTWLAGALSVFGAALNPPPPPATQAEVDAGVVTRKYVSPATLAGSTNRLATVTNAVQTVQKDGVTVTNQAKTINLLSGTNVVLQTTNMGAGVVDVMINAAGAVGGSATNILTGQSVWLDSVNGNNGTGARGRQDLPFLTPTNAKVAAQAGDTVIVRPGTYVGTDIMKRGVNYFFMPGAKVVWTNSGTDRAIFDDIGVATTNIIWGYGEFLVTAGGAGPATKTPTVLSVSNGLSRIYFKAWRAANDLGVEDNFTVARIRDAGLVIYEVDETIGHVDPQGTVSSGIMWNNGETHIRGGRITGDGRAAVLVETADAVVGKPWLFLNGTYLRGVNTAFQTEIFGGTNTNWMVYVSGTKMVGGGAQYGAMVVEGGTIILDGVNLEEEQARTGAPIGEGEAIIWHRRGTMLGNINNVVTFSRVYMGMSGDFDLTFNSIQFSNTTIPAPFFFTNTASGVIRNLSLSRADGPLVRNIGATVTIKDSTFELTDNQSTNRLIEVFGAGLTLNNVHLVAVASAPAIYATNAQTVTIAGGLASTGTNSAEITLAHVPEFFGFITPNGLTASRAAVIDASGRITNAAGTPDGTKFLRDDNTYATPPGGAGATNAIGQVSTNGTTSGIDLTKMDFLTSDSLVPNVSSNSSTVTVKHDLITGAKGTNLNFNNITNRGVLRQEGVQTNLQFVHMQDSLTVDDNVQASSLRVISDSELIGFTQGSSGGFSNTLTLSGVLKLGGASPRIAGSLYFCEGTNSQYFGQTSSNITVIATNLSANQVMRVTIESTLGGAIPTIDWLGFKPEFTPVPQLLTSNGWISATVWNQNATNYGEFHFEGYTLAATNGVKLTTNGSVITWTSDLEGGGSTTVTTNVGGRVTISSTGGGSGIATFSGTGTNTELRSLSVHPTNNSGSIPLRVFSATGTATNIAEFWGTNQNQGVLITSNGSLRLVANLSSDQWGQFRTTDGNLVYRDNNYLQDVLYLTGAQLTLGGGVNSPLPIGWVRNGTDAHAGARVRFNPFLENSLGWDHRVVLEATSGATTTNEVTFAVTGGFATYPTYVTITADNQVVNTTNRSFIVLDSDNATATSRSVQLSPGYVFGQDLYMALTNTTTGRIEIVDETIANNCRISLSSTWTPITNQTIHLKFYGTNWLELSRSAN